MNYRLIALDVDGTLLNDDHKVTSRVKDAVKSASRNGAEIVLCTGRGSTSALPVMSELGLEGTMITHNGASIVDSATRSVQFETLIAKEAADRYVSYLRRQGIHFDMNDPFDLFVHELGTEAKIMYEHLRAKPILRSFGDGYPEHLVKLSVFAPKDVLDSVEREWGEWNHELQCIRSGHHFIDIQHLDASKGKALEKLAGMRGVPRERVLAIGNYYNDLGMIAFAGHGVAMGNSPEEVKAEANEVTATNNEDGVAVVLERLGLL